MNKTSACKKDAQGIKAVLDSPPRRFVAKGMAGLGATFASATLASAASDAQGRSISRGLRATIALPIKPAGGHFTPSSNAGRFLELSYPASAVLIAEII